MILAADKNSVIKLINQINSGNPAVIPTETVYGLAARIDQPDSVKKIFTIKKRPFFDPLIVHIYNQKQLRELTHFESPIIQKLCSQFWPGPLTLVLPKTDQVNPLITSGLDSVGIRMPSHPLALEVLKKIDVPLAAPSANLFGHTSPTKAVHVENDFQSKDLLILDGGDCQVGIESTVLKITPNLDSQKIELAILRKGFITKTQIEQALIEFKNNYSFLDSVDKKSSPGHMKHHYMPKIPLIFLSQAKPIPTLLELIEKDFAKIPDKIEEIQIRKPIFPIKNWSTLEFSEDAALASRELYDKLKTHAERNVQILIFEKKPFMNTEAWEGFLERISKAASLSY